MESGSTRAAAPNEFRVAGAFGRVGDLGRLFRVVARDDRIGGLAPGALLRFCLSLRHTILICTMGDWTRQARRGWCTVTPQTDSLIVAPH
jgi:hypothetical protein